MVTLDPGIWIASFLTMAIFSYAFKYNPVFKFAEHTFIAVTVGNALVQGIASVRDIGLGNLAKGNIVYIVPIILGLSLFTRFHGKYYWINRYGIAALVGVGTGIFIRTAMPAQVVTQIVATIQPLPGATPLQTFNTIMTILGTVSALIYFTFTINKVHERGPAGWLSKIGRYLMMIAFGAAFGNTVQSRMNFFLGRIRFLLSDWLGFI